jgi:hypothetical protein
VKIVAEQRFEPVAVTILNDPEDRRLRSRSSPHRAVISGKEPAGLIDVYRARASTWLVRRSCGPASSPLVR